MQMIGMPCASSPDLGSNHAVQCLFERRALDVDRDPMGQQSSDLLFVQVDQPVSGGEDHRSPPHLRRGTAVQNVA